MNRISNLLAEAKGQIKGRIVDNHIILDIPEKDVHYWSPQLNFRIEPHEEKPQHSKAMGLIGPRPAVWTLFMFIYFSVGLIGFFISAYGVSLWMIGEYSHFVWALPVAILFMLTAYRAGKYGEQLGHDQIELLKQFVRDALSLNTISPADLN